VSAPEVWEDAVLKVLTCPDMASKRWIWEQYDRHVQGNTADDSGTGGDAGVIRLEGSHRALAVTTDVTPRYVEADPVMGGAQAVAEAWRNLTAVGALPLAVTDNLNFGNPQRLEIMGQIVGAIEGMAAACRALDFPVVSGNVSLYNETNGQAILPTPAIGGVGLLADVRQRAGLTGLKEGQVLALAGSPGQGWFGASLYLRELCGREEGAPPPVDLAAERQVGDFVRGLIQNGHVRTVHDISDGGLACAAAELALASGVGLYLDNPTALPHHAFLFGEDQGRYLIAFPAEDADTIYDAATAAGVPVEPVGVVGGCEVAFGDGAVDLADLRALHEGWLPALMG
jgi:phosphoribosylformylglycinamidine synthase